MNSIRKIEIERDNWSEKKGQFKCKVVVDGKDGSTFYLNISQSQAQEMMKVIRPDLLSSLMEIGQEAEKEMRNYLES